MVNRFSVVRSRDFIVYQILFLVLRFRSGCFLRMLSRGGIHVVNSGDTIRLSCEFYMDDFNLFDNPVLWRKVQHQEEMQVNMMGNILEPFESVRRFKVTFVPEPSKYVLGLHIISSGLEDSGNYTCEVNGPQNVVLGFVTNYIFVRAPVESILITQAMNVTSLISSSSSSSSSSSDSRILLFTENQPTLLRCLAFGGYPPPQITLTIDPDDDDITHQFGLTYTAFMSGVRGLRLMQYTTDRWSQVFRVRAGDDGKRIRCTAVVSGMASISAFAGIRVQYAPIITCEATSAAVGDKNVFVRCEVRARPEVTSLFWLIDVNGTTVAEGDVINEYWTLSMIHEDGVLETNLYLRQVTLESYRQYRVVAENAVDIRIKEALLVEASPISIWNLESNVSRRDSRGGRTIQSDLEALPYGLEYLSNAAAAGNGRISYFQTSQLLTVPLLCLLSSRVYIYIITLIRLHHSASHSQSH